MNWTKNLKGVLGIVLVAGAMSACSDDYQTITGSQPGDVAVPDAPATLAAVTVSPELGNASVGGTVQLTAAMTDASGQPMSNNVAWQSLNGNIATVDANGLVTAMSVGLAKITVAAGAKADTATITVTGGSVTPPATGPRVGYYAAPNGSATNDGSYNSPWDLKTALTNNRAGAGDTLWLRGGTYNGRFSSSLRGAAGNPVVVRGYPGERAVLDAAAGTGTTSALRVGGDYSVFWGFELTNSNPSRTTTSTGNHERPNVVANYARHTKYINLVVHDGGVAFYSDPQYTPVEFVGNVIYNNGWQAPDRGHGHGLYLKSDGGLVTVRDNIVFNQLGYGAHLYSNSGSGKLNNIHLIGNVAFNNGTLANNSQSPNILFGYGETADDGELANNMTYYTPGKGGVNVYLGKGGLSNGDISVRDNYFAGGSTVMQIGFWSSLVMTGNTLIGATQLRADDPSLSTGSLLAANNPLSSNPSATKVFVRPNPYETGRANIVVYNWGRQGSVSVSLSGVVPSGAQFEIHNVQNLHGAPVASGTFSGGSVSIPLNAVAGPTPVGLSSSVVPSTGTEFGVFVVTIK